MNESMLDDGALVSLADLAAMAGVSRPAVSNWRRRFKDFPSPTQESGTATLFRFGDLKAWMTRHQKPLVGRSAEQAVWTALNPARDAVLPENAAEAGMAVLGYAAAAALDGEAVNEILKAVVGQDPSSLRKFLNDLARSVEQAGLPHLVGEHFPEEPRWLDRAAFFQEVARLALELGIPDVFEALLAASARGSRGAGEHTTPPAVARLLIALTSVRGTVLDFACGQGTLLLAAARAASNSEALRLVGQDINYTTSHLAQVRLLIHGLDAEIRTGDTLHADSIPSTKADLVMADPPFALHWRPEVLAASARLPFGIPPPRAADLAWVQCAITALRPGGRALIVTSMGPLFRGGIEAQIRRRLVEASCVRAVIALPSGLYPNTSLPVAVLVLAQPKDQPASDVVLVDASQLGTRVRGRTELSSSEVVQIVAAVRETSADQAIPVAVVSASDLTTGDCSLVPARWAAPGIEPQELVERMRRAQLHLRQATQSLAETRPLPTVTPSNGAAPTQSSSLLAMADSGLITLIRPRRVDAAKVGTGDTPVVRPQDLSDYLVTPSGFIDQQLLPPSTELTQPGDVLVLTDGRVRAGVDRRGGAVVVGPIQIVRPRSSLVSSEVLAALITHHGQQQATGVTVPRINLKSLEIPLLDAESLSRFEAALQSLTDHQRLAVALQEAVEEFAGALIVGVSTGSVRLVNGSETE